MNQAKLLSIWLFVCGIAVAQVQVPEGTKLRVRLEEDLSSASAQQGQPVRLSVLDEVKVGDAVVISSGADVTGRITDAVPKKFTKSGKLDFSVDRVAAADGEKILLRYNPEKKNTGGLQSGIINSGATMMLGPAGMLLGALRAKDATFQKGTIVEVFTDEAHTLKAATPSPTPQIAPANPAAQAPPTEPPVELVDVSVSSTPRWGENNR
jgi:hypothetical protein